jgi:hypothetical protein
VVTDGPPDRSISSAIVIGSSAVTESFWNQRRGARSRGVSEKGRKRPPETKTGTIFASAWTAMRAMARNSRNDLVPGSTLSGR